MMNCFGVVEESGFEDNAVLGEVEGQGTGIMLRWRK